MFEELRIKVVDTHTCGEPARIVTEGLPEVKGSTIAEKKQYLEENLDFIRRRLMFEPRGHNNMFGAVILEPTVKEADFGIVFMNTGGWMGMCGHNTIAMCVLAIETKMVEVTEPVTHITLETTAGLVHTRSEVENGFVKKVTLQNVPSFLYESNLSVTVPDIGEITFDVAFGGNFYALIEAAQLRVDIEPENATAIAVRGIAALHAIQKEIKVQHPEQSHINTIDGVEIYGPPKSKDANAQNAVVFGQYSIDRSPCGTGTCAKMAVLYSQGKLSLGEEFVHESIIRTKFTGKALEETTVGKYKALVSEISGTAFISGFTEFVFDKRDPLIDGFLLS